MHLDSKGTRRRALAVLVTLSVCLVQSPDASAQDAAHADGQTPHRARQAAVAWSQLSLRIQHQCGLKTDGTAWCWGDNSYGTIGATGAPRQPALTPTQVDGSGWVDIQVMSATTCGLKDSGLAYCWGWNKVGQVGSGGKGKYFTPQRIAHKWRSISMAPAVTCGISTKARLFCWGLTYLFGGEPGDFVRTPTRLPGRWRDFNTYQGCGIYQDRSLWCLDKEHRLRRLDAGKWKSLQPDSVIAGYCGLKTDNTAWCWGDNHDGQVGDGTHHNIRKKPKQVPGKWLNVWANGDHACGVKIDYTGWCWGRNNGGTLGVGDYEDRYLPTQVPGQWSAFVFDRNGFTTCGRQTDGSAWCWGDGLLTGTGTDSTAPQALTGSWNLVSAGAGVQADGSLWSWGSESSGELGNGGAPDDFVPVPELIG